MEEGVAEYAYLDLVLKGNWSNEIVLSGESNKACSDVLAPAHQAPVLTLEPHDSSSTTCDIQNYTEEGVNIRNLKLIFSFGTLGY